MPLKHRRSWRYMSGEHRRLGKNKRSVTYKRSWSKKTSGSPGYVEYFEKSKGDQVIAGVKIKTKYQKGI